MSKPAKTIIWSSAMIALCLCLFFGGRGFTMGLARVLGERIGCSLKIGSITTELNRLVIHDVLVEHCKDGLFHATFPKIFVELSLTPAITIPSAFLKIGPSQSTSEFTFHSPVPLSLVVSNLLIQADVDVPLRALGELSVRADQYGFDFSFLGEGEGLGHKIITGNLSTSGAIKSGRLFASLDFRTPGAVISADAFGVLDKPGFSGAINSTLDFERGSPIFSKVRTDAQINLYANIVHGGIKNMTGDVVANHFETPIFSSPKLIGQLTFHENILRAHGVMEFAARRVPFELAYSHQAQEYQLWSEVRELGLFGILEEFGVKNSYADVLLTAPMLGGGYLNQAQLFETTTSGVASSLTVRHGAAHNPQNPLILESTRPVNFMGKIKLNHEKITFAEFHLLDGLTSGLVNADIAFNKQRGLNLSFDFDKFGFESVNNHIANVKFVGTGDAKGQIFGPYREIVIDANAAVKPFGVSSLKLTSANARLLYSNRKLAFENGEAMFGEGRAQFDGDITFVTGAQEFSFLAQSSETQMADILTAMSFRNVDVLGAASFDGAVKFVTKGHQTKILHATVDGGIAALAINGVKLADLVAFRMNDDAFNLLAFNDIKEILNVSGEWDTKLKSLSILGKQIPISWGLSHGYVADVKADIAYDLGKWQGSMSAAALPLDTKETARFILAGEVVDSVAKMDVTTPFLNARVFFGLAEKGIDISGDVTIEDLKPQNLWLGYSSLPEGLRLDGHMSVFGHYPFLGAPDISVEFKQLKLASEGQTLHLSEPVTVDILGDKSIDAKLFMRGERNASLNLSFSKNGEDFLGTADLKAPLTYLPKFFDIGYGDEGRFELQAEIKAPSLSSLSSNLKILNARPKIFQDQLLDPEINATFDYRDKTLEISSDVYQNEVRTARIAGHIFQPLSEAQDLNLQIYPEGLVISSDLGRTNLDGKLSLFGPRESMYVTGHLSASLASIKSSPLGFYRRRLPSFLSKITSDVALTISPDTSWLTAFGEGTVGGDVVVTGSIASPKLNGQLTLNDGVVRLFNHAFFMSDGQMQFFNNEPMRGDIALKAEARIDDYVVHANVTGALDNPELALTSIPNLTEEEIARLMILGDPKEENQSLLGGLSSLSFIALTSVLGLKNQLPKVGGLASEERIFLVSDDHHANTQGLPRLGLGMRLTPGLKLKWLSDGYGVGQKNSSQEIRLEQNFLPNLGMRLNVIPESRVHSDAGADFWYRMEF